MNSRLGIYLMVVIFVTAFGVDAYKRGNCLVCSLVQLATIPKPAQSAVQGYKVVQSLCYKLSTLNSFVAFLRIRRYSVCLVHSHF